MSTDYVKKFSYRTYEGSKESRVRRIWSLALFEMRSTWRKSVLGKALLIILSVVIVFPALIYISIGLVGGEQTQSVEEVKNFIIELAADYLSISGSLLTITGLFVIPLIGIAGSGYFADDKQGNVIEIYLSRLRKGDYAIGKIIGMVLYANIFITLPLLLLALIYVQGFDFDHFLFLEFYGYLILYGIIISLLLSLSILVLSTIIDKRAYASLTFTLFYFIASSFGRRIGTFGDEYLLLLSPQNLSRLLAYSILGNYEATGFGSGIGFVLLDDGSGLEYLDVIGLVILLILSLFIFLLYKIYRFTTDNI